MTGDFIIKSEPDDARSVFFVDFRRVSEAHPRYSQGMKLFEMSFQVRFDFSLGLFILGISCLRILLSTFRVGYAAVIDGSGVIESNKTG